MQGPVTFPRCPGCGTVMTAREAGRTHDRPALSWHECSCGHTTPKLRFLPAPTQSFCTSAPRHREPVTC